MLLAAMLAMVLAAAAPALAQVDLGDETSVQYVDCSQVQAALAAQGQYGDANAGADDDSAAAASIAQDLGITQQQANACLGEGGNIGDVNVDGGTAAAGDDGSAAAAGSAAAGSAAAGSAAAGGASAAAAGELPETGGASLLALGAGALLVAGGLVARRIVR